MEKKLVVALLCAMQVSGLVARGGFQPLVLREYFSQEIPEERKEEVSNQRMAVEEPFLAADKDKQQEAMNSFGRLISINPELYRALEAAFLKLGLLRSDRANADNLTKWVRNSTREQKDAAFLAYRRGLAFVSLLNPAAEKLVKDHCDTMSEMCKNQMDSVSLYPSEQEKAEAQEVLLFTDAPQAAANSMSVNGQGWVHPDPKYLK